MSEEIRKSAEISEAALENVSGGNEVEMREKEDIYVWVAENDALSKEVGYDIIVIS